MKLRILIASFLSLAAAGFIVAAPSDTPGLVVHEWGTFLTMSGSDGISLDGMYHEEHALPSFVHARSRDQLRLPTSLMKGETPVIYFYAQNYEAAWKYLLRAEQLRYPISIELKEVVWSKRRLRSP